MLKVSNLIAASWDEIPAKTLQILIPSRDKESDTTTDTPAVQTIEESAMKEQGTEEQVSTSEAAKEFQTLFEQLGQRLSEEEVSEWIETVIK